MKIDRIHFEELFPTGSFANQRLRVEATTEESDDIIQCYQTLKDKVEEAFKKMNPGLDQYFPMTGLEVQPYENPIRAGNTMGVQQDPKEKWVQEMIKGIEECTEVSSKNGLGVETGLLSFSDSTSVDARILVAYDLKFIQLKKQ